ncbi:lysozyme inhibitor LprI family protein [Bradyrhizobium septentrionale]|uniref:lysozyme inhibitor LprI family protein n=1 Tax=Bradyrhizobium septentrionale TaxID=1404411 RepID=UPI0030D5FE71
MLFIFLVLLLLAVTIASVTSHRAHSTISWLLIFAPAVLGAGTGATQERGLVPRGADRPSFDCAQAKTAAARLICADGELTRLDRELGAAYQRQKAQLPASDQSQFVADQLSWIRDRNARCGLDGKEIPSTDDLVTARSCMADAIRSRISDRALAPADKRPQEPNINAGPMVGHRTPAQSQQDGKAHPLLNVRINVSLTDEPRPWVRGITNLPDGTNLQVWVRKAWRPDASRRLAAGLAACGDDCWPLMSPEDSTQTVASVNAKVVNGSFAAGPFVEDQSKNSPPPSGRYILEVSGWSARQPADVLEIIGHRGENLTGPLIEGCCLGPPQSILVGAREFRRRWLSIDDGVLIYYGRYVEIGSRDHRDESARQGDNRSGSGLIPPWRPGIESSCCTDEDRQNAIAAARAQSNASGALLDYENTMRPLIRATELANKAAICGLRSDRYQRTFKTAQLLTMSKLTVHLTQDELLAADVDMQKTVGGTRSEIGLPDLDIACRTLLSGSYLQQLDEMERELTANYH